MEDKEQVDWSQFEDGTASGQQESKDGVILRDEEHLQGARITLEQNADTALFSITCGIYGWMFHTRFFPTMKDAEADFDGMKERLAAIVAIILLQNDPDFQARMKGVGDAISDFVEHYP